MEKTKVYCQRRFSKQNVLLKLSVYSTRVLVVMVWCGVLWSLLTTGALPRQYVEYLMSRNPGSCIKSSVTVPTEHRDQYLDLLPATWNSSLSTAQYQLLTFAPEGGDNSSYQVLLVKQNSSCLNLLEFKGYVVLVQQNWTGGSEASGSGDDMDETATLTTDFLASDSVDLLDLLYPEQTSASLLDIPSGHFFALTLLAVVSAVCGVLAKWVFLPQLIGMILAGFLLRNVPGIDFARHISNVWSSNIRNIALVVVLTRGGLSMDFKQLKRLKLAVFLLAAIPCIVEGAVDGLVATFWLKLPWQFAFTLGYTVAAISPAVVVPTTLSLESQGFGVESGIPTLIVGAASIDVVIVISIFGIFLGLAFSGGSLVLDIVRAPIQVIVGILYGVLFGLLLWIFPNKYFKRESKVRNRFFLLFGLGLFCLFGSTRVFIGGSSLAGSGALGALVLAFMAGQGWKKEEKKLVSRAFYIVWQFIEPLLFGLIGAAVDLQFISSSLVGQAILLILVGLVIRIACSYVVVLGNGFSWLEMCFVAIAWLPKATVQAAIGSLALDIALSMNDERTIDFGRQILTVAVLAVVLTAPVGALASSLLGPVLLKKKVSDEGPPEEDGSPEDQPPEDQPPEDQLPENQLSEEGKVADRSFNGKSGTYEVNSPSHASPPSNSIKPVNENIELIVISEIDSEPRKY